MSTITNLESTTNGADSRGIINTNFGNLNDDKLEKSGGTLTGKISFSGTGHVGLRLNNLTTTQRDALTPALGDKIFNTTTDQEEVYTSSGWVAPTGSSDATSSVKGVVELATSTEIDNGTATGGTGAGLGISPDQLALSKYTSQLPTSDEKAAMSGADSPDASNVFLVESDTTETPTASKIPIADGSGKIANGWINTVFGGDGSDGALTISSGTTTIDLGNADYVVKNYTSISITGTGKLAFSNPGTNGTIIILKSQGDCTLTSSQTPMIDASGLGSAIANNGLSIIDDSNHYGSNGTGGGAGDGAGGGGGGGAITAGQTGTAGRNGGGGLLANGGAAGVIYTLQDIYNAVQGEWSLSRKSLYYAIGSAGGNGGTANAAGGGGGGGGAAGMFIGLYNSLTANTGTINISGGTGGAGANVGTAGGAGGRGGSVLLMECAGTWNFTTSNGISVAGADGSVAGDGAGSTGGGDGGAGGDGSDGASLVAENKYFF